MPPDRVPLCPDEVIGVVVGGFVCATRQVAKPRRVSIDGAEPPDERLVKCHVVCLHELPQHLLVPESHEPLPRRRIGRYAIVPPGRRVKQRVRRAPLIGVGSVREVTQELFHRSLPTEDPDSGSDEVSVEARIALEDGRPDDGIENRVGEGLDESPPALSVCKNVAVVKIVTIGSRSFGYTLAASHVRPGSARAFLSENMSGSESRRA
jgi:hypothetical protein